MTVYSSCVLGVQSLCILAVYWGRIQLIFILPIYWGCSDYMLAVFPMSKMICEVVGWAEQTPKA